MSERELFEAYIESQLGAKPETWKAAVTKYGCYPVAPAIEDNYFSRSIQERWETWQAALAAPAAAAEPVVQGQPPIDNAFVTPGCEQFPEAAASVQRPSDELQQLRDLAATCYAGLGGECDLPENWLDALNAAANGEPFSLDGLLPYRASPRIEAWKAKAEDYDRLAGIARNRRMVLEEIATLRNLTATDKQFWQALQRLAQKAVNDYSFRGYDGEDDDATPAAAAEAGAPGATDAERAEWLADKIVSGGDYAKEAATMLRRWPTPVAAAEVSPVVQGEPVAPSARALAIADQFVSHPDVVRDLATLIMNFATPAAAAKPSDEESIEDVKAAYALLFAENYRLFDALQNLYATVKGECPALLDEDRGGNSGLAMEIEELLASPAAAAEVSDALLEQARIALGLMLSYHGQGAADYADVAQVRAQEAYDAVDAALTLRTAGSKP